MAFPDNISELSIPNLNEEKFTQAQEGADFRPVYLTAPFY